MSKYNQGMQGALILFALLFCGVLISAELANNRINNATPKSPINAKPSNPYLNYTFDDVIYDSSGNGPAVYLNGLAQVASNGGIEAGYLMIPNGPDNGQIQLSSQQNTLFSAEFTIMIWVKQLDNQNYLQELVRKGNSINDFNFRIFIESTTIESEGKVAVGFTDQNSMYRQINAKEPLSKNVWHLITFVKSFDKFSLIIDGIKQGEMMCDGQAKTNGMPIELGTGATNIHLDEFKIWIQSFEESYINQYYSKYKPIAQFTTNSTFITIGEPIQFNELSYGGVAPYSYLWEFDDGQTRVESNPIMVFTNSSKAIYVAKLTIMDQLGNISVTKQQIFVNVTQSPGAFTAWNDTITADGFITIHWTQASLAQKYYLIENGTRVMEFPVPQDQIRIQRPIGSYDFCIEAVNIVGSSFSNHLYLQVIQNLPPVPPPSNDQFTLWGENVEIPNDLDGKYRLMWKSYENVEAYKIFENNVSIAQTSNIGFDILKNSSGTFNYFVEAKFINGTVLRSMNWQVNVSLNNTNINTDDKPTDTQNDGNDIAELIMNFLQQNGLTVGLTGGAAAILGVVLNSLKKGNFKLKIPTNLPSNNGPAIDNSSIDDFLDGDL